MWGAVLVWVGLAWSAFGTVAIVTPLRRLFVPTRGRAVAIAALGVAVAIAGLAFPAVETRVPRVETRLDAFVPVYQFSERHTADVAASPDRVYDSIRAVTADEIALFQTLTFIRRFGRPGPESILKAPGKRPLLDVATSTSFLLLVDEPPRELVIGTLVSAPRGFRIPKRPTPEWFDRLSGPGLAKAVMNFWITPNGAGGSHLSTETRVFATDADTCRRFARYWHLIYPGSALIRRMWLRAIRLRAERPGPTG